MQSVVKICLFIVIASFLLNCRKAKPDIDEADPPEYCAPFKLNSSRMPLKVNREMARFDPVYPEIIYYLKVKYDSINLEKHIYKGKSTQLIAYNLRSNEYQIILSNNKLDTSSKKISNGIKKFSVGFNDWIVLQDSRNAIWKIKKDGTLLKKIRDNGSNPSWNKEGTEILIYDHITKQNTIIDVDGNTISSFHTNTGNLQFSGVSGVLVGLINNTVFQYNTDYQTTTNNLTSQIGTEFSDIALMPNGYELILCQESWIMKVNLVDTTVKEGLRMHCLSRFYTSPDVSRDGNRIIFTKINLDDIGHQWMSEQRDIYIMDNRCWHSKKLNLP